MQAEQKGSKDIILESLNEHLSHPEALFTQFYLTSLENEEPDQEWLNTMAVINIAQDLVSEFPDRQPDTKEDAQHDATPRFYLAKTAHEAAMKSMKARHFDYGRVARSVIFLCNLASQGFVQLEFDRSPQELEQMMTSQDFTAWDIDFRSEPKYTDDVVDPAGLAVVHLPSNLGECFASENKAVKALAYSTVFGSAYALDWCDRALMQGTEQIKGFENGIFDLHRLPEIGANFERTVESYKETGLRNQVAFFNFYQILLDLPDTRTLE